jgi:hypothetical protein
MNNNYHIHIGVEESSKGFDRFIDAWKRAETGKTSDEVTRLNFEDLSMLLSVLTPRRFEVLKTLRQNGPATVKDLSLTLKRQFKSVNSDTILLEKLGLIERTDENTITAPWDVIDAHLNLVA